ncbi:MAG: archaemetzincin family Zn-dependent metalloprotease [Planctomycetota bacterium]|nr:archaemetzincin family Zn-dependent metalloprotease [Planctomycetota bacterium]
MIQPIGSIEPPLLVRLADTLVQSFCCSIAINDAIEPPPASYDLKRRQYMVSGLLPALLAAPASPGSKILGITYYDICNPIFAFVFGEAQRDGRAAIISLARLQPEYYGAPPNPERFFARVLTEAVHEIAHTIGLPHCAQPDCVMALSNSIVEIDRKGPNFCASCAHLLRAAADKGQT